MIELFDNASIYSFPIAAVSLTIFFVVLIATLQELDLPPGPTGIPLLGYYPFLREDYHVQLQELAKKYGDVYSIRIAGQLFIHISSLKAHREAHIVKNDYFHDRMDSYNVLKECFSEGLSFHEGERWKTLRKFYVQKLKEYGFASVKENIAGPLYDSLHATIEDIKATKGEPFDAVALFTKHATQTMQQLLFKGYEISKEDSDTLNSAYMDLLGGQMDFKLMLMGWIAKYILLPFSAGHREMIAGKETMTKILTRIVRNHEDTMNEDHPRDLVDSYLKERNERSRKNDPTAEYFTEQELVSTLVQLVGDSVISVGHTISLFLKSVVDHPEVQENIYKELVEVVGADRQPSWEDKSSLVYCNAAILEILRSLDFLSIFPSRKCIRETTLNGYKIPVGSVTLVNNWAIYHDPELYEDPDTFDPTRFIAKPNKPKAETPTPLGVGKRSCAGEPFVMMQVFMFLLTIVKNFKLTMPEQEGSVHETTELKMEFCAHLRNKS